MELKIDKFSEEEIANFKHLPFRRKLEIMVSRPGRETSFCRSVVPQEMKKLNSGRKPACRRG